MFIFSTTLVEQKMNMGSAVAAIYLANPIDVDNRLEILGWARSELLEVVGAMVAARHSCTDNDPTAAPGWMSWKDGTRRIREIGRAKGLHKDEFAQIPCVFDSKRKLRFSVSNTDDGTALEDRIPQNRSKKGPGTEGAANGNKYLFDGLDGWSEKITPLSRMRPQPGIIVSWFLLVYCEGDDVRAELSCPIEVDGGFFADFHERIVLIGPDDGSGGIGRRLPDEGPEFDIPVSRK
jgi:hypothetical protein